jgi:hypothetical protein
MCKKKNFEENCRRDSIVYALGSYFGIKMRRDSKSYRPSFLQAGGSCAALV